MSNFRMDDYVPVNARIEEFYERYPEGSIQTEIVTHTDALVVVKAWAYRTPDDLRPCTAHSQLAIPGRTNFTRDSEVENAETSAVGRALAMLGFAVKEGMASREEVRNKSGAEEPRREPPASPLAKVAQELGATPALRERLEGASPDWRDAAIKMMTDLNLTPSDVSKFIDGPFDWDAVAAFGKAQKFASMSALLQRISADKKSVGAT